MSRRAFLQTTAGLAATACCATPAAPRPAKIIDTHVHFFDPTRPQDVPWPPKDNALLYRTTLPQHYRALPVPQRVDGTIVVEASTWVEDNQWILDLAARDPFIVGLVGNLPPGTPEFAGYLKRFSANPLFRGVRIRDGNFAKLLDEPAFIKDLRDVAERGLVFDVHSTPAWVGQADRLAWQIPNLRLIINHVANAEVNGREPPAAWLEMMEKLAAHPQVYMKVSGLVEGTKRRNGDAPAEPEIYRPVLDILWKLFGADRLLYGSNWPVSGHNAPLGRVQQIALDFFAGKGQAALDKVFWKNAQRAYGVKA
jgi:predicted TIM-barrel fold metal-dependent hydrolase